MKRIFILIFLLLLFCFLFLFGAYVKERVEKKINEVTKVSVTAAEKI